MWNLTLLFTFRAGVQTRVRGEGPGAGEELAESCVRGDEISVRFPPASLYLQVINGPTSDPSLREAVRGKLNNPGQGWGGNVETIF